MNNNMETTNYPCVVVGSGVAGLSAALHLSERGLKPVVLEADTDYCGGRLKSRDPVTITGADGKVWSFPAEHGLHGLWWQYKNFKAMAARHGFMPELVFADKQNWLHGEESGKVRRAEMGKVVRRTIWPAPVHYGALFFRPSFLTMLTPSDYLKIPLVLGTLITATGMDPLVEGRSLEGLTLADYCKGWPPRMTAFLASLARSGLSAHPEEVPLAGFIAFLRFYTLLRRDSQRFHFLPDDPETCYIGPLVAKIKELGGQIRMGCRVLKLNRLENNNWEVFLENGEKLETEELILATDAPATQKLLSESEPTREVAASMKWPQAMETIVIRFWFSTSPSEKLSEAGIISGNFTLDNSFWLHRIIRVFGEWHRATGGSAVETHIYSAENLALPDEELMERACQDIYRMFPDMQGKIIKTTLQRNTPNHTIFGVGSLSQHIGVRTPWPGLGCCGDWVRSPIPALFIERACATGILAANAVLERKGLQPFVLEKYDKPEFLARIVGGWVSGVRGSVQHRKKS
jgi:isorenieratene synthase